MKNFTKMFKALIYTEQGAVLPLVGLAFAVLLLATGFTIDYTRAQMARERLQWALDAAALAGAKAGPDIADVRKAANDYFEANFPKGYMDTTHKSVTVSGVDTVTGKGEGYQFSVNNMKIENYITNVVGIQNLSISASAQVNTLPAGPQDVVIALDASGSMLWRDGAGDDCLYPHPSPSPERTYCLGGTSRIHNAKIAMRNFVDILSVGEDVRFGIVPWDQKVNAGGNILNGVGGGNHMVASLNNTGNARPGDTPDGGGYYLGESLVHSNTLTYDGREPLRPMTYLTKNANTVRNAIDAQEMDGNTDSALGMLWARRMFRNNTLGGWRNWDGVAAQRSIILLTDGVNTKDYRNPGMFYGDAPRRAVNQHTVDLCNAAKNNEGIKVYTIAYNMVGTLNTEMTEAHEMLRSCASTGCKSQPGGRCYFNAGNATQLNNAMRAISETMMTMRLTK